MRLASRVGRCTLGVLATLLSAATSLAEPLLQEAPTAASGLESTVRDLIVKRLQAFERSDAAAYRQLVAPEFVHVDDTGTRRSGDALLRHISSHGDYRARHEVGELVARRFGDLVLVDYSVVEYVAVGPRERRLPAHQTDVLVLRKGRWLFLQHAETLVLASPATVVVVGAPLDDYVGRYQWWPGYVETISRRGDDLYVQDTGDDQALLMHSAGGESYFVEGDLALVVFARDAHGKVTQELVHFPDGQVVVAVRIKP